MLPHALVVSPRNSAVSICSPKERNRLFLILSGLRQSRRRFSCARGSPAWFIWARHPHGHVALAPPVLYPGHESLHPRLLAAEDLHEHGFEFVAEGAVHQDVDGRVDGNEQVRDFDEVIVRRLGLKVF